MNEDRGPLTSEDIAMPILFLGHGNPMNAIEENEFVKGFRAISKDISKPKAILCISAHWETRGTFVTAMPHPQTIHDFGGFPQPLFQVQYPAPGSPELAERIQELITQTTVLADDSWGLDHGAWSVIKHLYPNADIPVVELSIDHDKSASYHYELAKALAPLRQEGILIIGSGNIVHNLRRVAWDKFNDDNYGYDWAIEANEKIKKAILERDHQALINYPNMGASLQLSAPTPEHFIPLIYILALQKETDSINIFNDKLVGGSLSMTSVMYS